MLTPSGTSPKTAAELLSDWKNAREFPEGVYRKRLRVLASRRRRNVVMQPRAVDREATVFDFGLECLIGRRMRVLEHLRPCRLDPHRVGDWKLIEQGAYGLEQCRSEEIFVFGRER